MTVFEISRAAFNCFGHAKQNRSRIQNHAKAELEELFCRKPWGLAAAFEHANGQWNLSEFLPDLLQLLQIGWFLEVNAVGPGLEICFASRFNASRRPCGSIASVRARIKNSGFSLAAQAASILCTIDFCSITFLPSICPHFFGAAWSSMKMAETPIASYSRMVRVTLLASP